ncbi:DUF4376 domain-containing protein [Jeongeupia wiesaeckerbachi]|uniref:DUF4376 domain-containing protein n=1 Tax=Jeongeupia wiesaeckerbachi TaxID=3051218 RepID=UPI003D806F6F
MPAVSIGDLQTIALATLPGWEQAERAAGIDHANHRWLTTPAALQDIRDALLAGIVPSGVWITAEREPVPLTLTELQVLWAECVARGAAIYQRRLAMEAEITTLDRAALEAFKPAWPITGANQ